MPSSDIFRPYPFCNVVLCAGVHACGSRHEPLLVPCNEVLPGGHLDEWDGGQVGDVDRDDVGRVSGCFFRHSCSGLPDPTDVGQSIDFTHFQIVRFPRRPFHRVNGAESLQPGGASLLGQDSSSNVRLSLASCKELCEERQRQ
jgi:hypothetical protein